MVQKGVEIVIGTDINFIALISCGFIKSFSLREIRWTHGKRAGLQYVSRGLCMIPGWVNMFCS